MLSEPMDPFYAGDGWRGSICVKTRRCLLKSFLLRIIINIMDRRERGLIGLHNQTFQTGANGEDKSEGDVF